MSKEIPTNLMAILSADWTVHPKRNLDIPSIDRMKLMKAHPDLIPRFDYWMKYLAGRPVSDTRGADHTRRRREAAQIYARYMSMYGSDVGNQLIAVANDNNQLRMNRLSLVKLHTARFENYLQTMQKIKEAELVKHYRMGMHVRLNGGQDPNEPSKFFGDYNKLADVQTKIGIVHYFEDKIVAMLGMMPPLLHL